MKKVLIALITFVASLLAFQWWFKNWILVFIVLASLAIHELSHAAVLLYYGKKISAIFFVPFLGAAVVPEGNPEELSFSQRAAVAAAGPLSNLGISLIAAYLYFSNPENTYVAAALSVNVSLLFFNLLPFALFDGGKVASAIFESSTEEKDTKIAATIRLFALVGGLALILLHKFSISYLLIIWGIWKSSTSDDPRNACGEKAMSSDQIKIAVFLYTFVLIGSMIAAVFVPNWAQLFHIWPTQ